MRAILAPFGVNCVTEIKKLSTKKIFLRHGLNMIRNVTLKDIVGKGLSELNLPKNVKVTPRLKPKPQYEQPISADDEVIVSGC